MQSAGKLFILSVLTVLAINLGLAGNPEIGDQSDEWYSLVQSVRDILTGSPATQTVVRISPEAQLAIGDTILSLSDVVSGKDKTRTLLEKSEQNAVSLHLKVNDAKDAAFLIFKTRPEPEKLPRLHTVVFMKDSKGGWLIESWHTSK